MRFFFNAANAEEGFVWFRDDAFNNCVEVADGYGSERRTGVYKLPRRDSHSTKLTNEDGEQYCRRAIFEFTQRGGANCVQGHIDERTPAWDGELSKTARLK